MRTIILLTLACANAAWGQITFDPGTLHEIANSERVQVLPHAKSGNPTRGYDLRYHRLELNADPSVRAISGVVTHYFTATMDLDEVIFDLSGDLVVSSVEHQGTSAPFVHAGDLLSVTLPSTLVVGQLDSLSITYGGIPPDTGFGSFVQDEHNGAPVIWTLSEPYGARDWWPCKQDLNDKADSLDVIVVVPSGQRVAGNGLLVEETDLGNGTVRFHWRHRHPIDYYLVAFAVTNYSVYSNMVPLPGATVEVLNYVYPEDQWAAEGVTPGIIEQMQLYSELFGEYPFADEKYGHAQMSWAGGMEHQTMTFLGGYSYELLAHELAHQWFGDLVTCGSWEDLWLNEGWATYLSGLCYEHLAPQYWMPFKAERKSYITSQPGGSVLVTDTTSINRLFDSRLTYAKGAYVLHMLRWVCGDAAFFQGVNNYLNDPLHRNSSALTSEFIAHLEATSGLDLSEFVADWYVGEGFPTYGLVWSQAANGDVSVQLDQTTSHPSVDFFEMPVPIRFKNGTMEETRILDHTSSGQTYSFNLPFQADSALFDPELWILSGQNLVLQVPEGALGNNEVLLLYPDPVADAAWIHVGTALRGTIDLEVIDNTGRIVRSVRTQVDQLRIPLNATDLVAGYYTVRLRSNDRTYTLRFVKA
ncbi:MAG: T9SS type A sorting domain-containing protein [Flavobacteriales bacterium]|nr:T9SS type A sorting domain-containing protein [Flavobacteriales bacterium]